MSKCLRPSPFKPLLITLFVAFSPSLFSNFKSGRFFKLLVNVGVARILLNPEIRNLREGNDHPDQYSVLRPRLFIASFFIQSSFAYLLALDSPTVDNFKMYINALTYY